MYLSIKNTDNDYHPFLHYADNNRDKGKTWSAGRGNYIPEPAMYFLWCGRRATQHVALWARNKSQNGRRMFLQNGGGGIERGIHEAITKVYERWKMKREREKIKEIDIDINEARILLLFRCNEQEERARGVFFLNAFAKLFGILRVSLQHHLQYVTAHARPVSRQRNYKKNSKEGLKPVA